MGRNSGPTNAPPPWRHELLRLLWGRRSSGPMWEGRVCCQRVARLGHIRYECVWGQARSEPLAMGRRRAPACWVVHGACRSAAEKRSGKMLARCANMTGRRFRQGGTFRFKPCLGGAPRATRMNTLVVYVWVLLPCESSLRCCLSQQPHRWFRPNARVPVVSSATTSPQGLWR